MAPPNLQPDPDQRDVLDHAAGALVIIGAAGTGKTAVLLERFARLLEGGADPERVALVVRSKRARDEARSHLSARLPRSLPALRVTTAHGLAYLALSQRYAPLGYAEAPTVLDAAEQFALVRELLEGEDPDDWPAYGAILRMHGFADQVRQFVLRAQEALRTPTEVQTAAAARGLHGWAELARFFARYLQVLDDQGAVDFAGLIQQAAAATDAAPVLDHLLVDDYQDATFGIDRLVTGAAAESLVLAGNLEAHVFSFQGTTDEPLRDVAVRLACPEVVLTTRHRGIPSTEAVLAAHTAEEHAAIARELRRIHVEEGVAWRDLAVVVRREGGDLAALLRALDDARLPHTRVHGGLSPVAAPATYPYVLALHWLAADPQEREELVEALLTSELGGLSPATTRALLRSARASALPATAALDATEGLTEDERDRLTGLRDALDHAAERSASVLDAFATLWRELPCSARLVAAAETSDQTRGDLDSVVALARAAEDAGASADPSIPSFLDSLAGLTDAPRLAEGARGQDAVQVLTAHATAGLEFDTVLVVGAVEGNFPSLTRPEPMFDLSALEEVRGRAQTNRLRLADERRLFRMVLDRASRRVVLTASRPQGRETGEAATSRFVDELSLPWTPLEAGIERDPVSVAEAAARWRRTFADAGAAPADRLAALEGLLALGAEPGRWWFQHDWSGTDAGPRETHHLSFSRLDHLENCELQYLLAAELGLDSGGGYQAWVGHLIHGLIEDIENGKVPRTLEAFIEQVDQRWQPSRFPSHAVSEAERLHALEVIVPNWVQRYGDLPAFDEGTERRFTFDYDGAIINGVIDRIGPLPDGRRFITDFKTGNADNAPKVAESLQLGIYYLATAECEDLAPYRPIDGVELSYLAGKRGKGELVSLTWDVSDGKEEDYKARMRERLSGLIGRVRELDIAGEAIPSTKANCRFCGFQTLCPIYPQGGSVFPVPSPAEEGSP